MKQVEAFDEGMDLLESALETTKLIADGDQILFGVVRLLEDAKNSFLESEKTGEDLELFSGTKKSLDEMMDCGGYME